MEMLGGVLVLGRVATSDVPAAETKPEMDPSISHLHALFADVHIGFADFDLVEMGHPFAMVSPEEFNLASSDLGHVTKGHNHSYLPPFSLTMGVGGSSYVLRLDYVSCVLTIVSTILVGRRCWEGWVLSGVNSAIICVIGVRTAQLGFVPANVFCIVVAAVNMRAWRRSKSY